MRTKRVKYNVPGSSAVQDAVFMYLNERGHDPKYLSGSSSADCAVVEFDWPGENEGIALLLRLEELSLEEEQ